jgi:hypothetical protein
MDTKLADELILKAVNDLREHIPNVQILASWEEDNGETVDIYCGKGNIHALVGMAHDFLVRHQAQETAIDIAAEIARQVEEDLGAD